MSDLIDLSDYALDEYKKMVDSELFTEQELSDFLQYAVEPKDGIFGISLTNVMKFLGASKQNITIWTRRKAIEGVQCGRQRIFNVNEIIKMKQIQNMLREGLYDDTGFGN